MQRATILEARALGRHGAQTVVRFFQTHEAGVAHHPRQHVRRVGADGHEFGVRAAVRHASHAVRRGHQLGGEVFAHVARRGQELGLEFVGNGDVEHGVHGMLVLDPGDFFDGLADVSLEFGPDDRLDGEVLERTGHHRGVAGVVLGDECLSDGRIPELCEPLGRRPHRHFPHYVVAVEQAGDLPEVEVQPLAHDDRLVVYLAAGAVGLVHPAQDAAVDAGPVVAHRGRVEQDRPARLVGQAVVELHVRLEVLARLGELDEAPAAFLEHAPEGQYVLVRHRVGHHRRAVVVALHGHEAVAQALRREPAAADVERLFQDPAHGRHFGFGRRPALGGIQPHRPDHDRGQRHVAHDVQPLGRPVQEVEPFGEGRPVPLHAGLHRLVGNRLDARHGQHGPVAHVGLDRSEPEAAVAHHDGGDSMPTGQRAVRVPIDLRVVMSVQIDEAGGHD